MLPLQILLVNLLSDFPMILVATDNVDDEVVKAPRRYNLKGFAASALSFGFISTAFDFAVFRSFFPMGEASLQTYWFIESILSELLFLFTIRSTKPFFMAKSPSKPLLVLTAVTILLTIAIPYTEIGRNVFGFVRPELPSLLWVLGIVTVYLISNEVAKGMLRKYSSKQ
jgi:Mg2+-importing ATPase